MKGRSPLPIVAAAVRVKCHPVTVERLIRAGFIAVEWRDGRRLVDVVELGRVLETPPAERRQCVDALEARARDLGTIRGIVEAVTEIVAEAAVPAKGSRS